MEPIVFWGSPKWAVEFLEFIKNQWGLPILQAVVTQPDKPAGRFQKLTPTPVKQWAQTHHIQVLAPSRLTDPEFQTILKSLNPQLGLVVAYGKIIPPSIIDLFPKGLINIHPSLLPKWRGANPIGRCLQKGESISGVTLQRINPQLDAGDILAQQSFPIEPNDTCLEVFEKAYQVACQLLKSVLPAYLNGEITAYTQDHAQATYAPKFTNSEAQISWQLPAWNVHNHIRALGCWDGAFTFLGPKRVKIWKSRWPELGSQSPAKELKPGQWFWDGSNLWVGCSDQPIQIEILQTEGYPKQLAQVWYQSQSRLLSQHPFFMSVSESVQ